MGRKLFPVVILVLIGFGLALILLTRPDSGGSDSGGSDSGNSVPGTGSPKRAGTATVLSYPSGKPMERRVSVQERGRLIESEYVRWSEDGQKRADLRGQNSDSGTGTFWFEGGQKAAEGEFKLGKRHGRVITWHENGQKASEGEYRNGKPHGKVVTWLETGQKWEEGEYRDGKRHGKFILWGEDGKQTSLTYENGRLIR